mgnify:CR=1 FL=1
MKRSTWPWLFWLMVMVASWLQVSKVTVVTDVSSFLPGPVNASQGLMVDQLRDGLSTRTLLIGLRLAPRPGNAAPSPEQMQALVAASRALRSKLAADPQFAWVSNGDAEALSAERDLIFDARYLLAPGVNPQHFSTPGLTQAFAELELALGSARGVLIRPIATADPTLTALQLLGKTPLGAAPQTAQGVWLGANGTAALLLMETKARGNDIEAMRNTLDSAKRTAQAVLQTWPDLGPAPVVELAGASYFNVQSHDAIGQDANQLALLALGLVAALLLWALRSPRFLALALVPVVTGALAGFAVVAWVNHTIHGITLAFGVTLIGEAVDYAIYTHVQADASGQRPVRFWRQIYLAAFTSLIGFAAMYFSGFAGLQQLGLFSIVGLLAAVMCTRWLLPPLLKHSSPARNLFAWVPSLCAAMRRLRAGVLVLALAAVALIGLRQASVWQDNLDSLSPSSALETARDQAYRDDVGVPDLRTMVTVQGASLEEALLRTEVTAQVLDTLIQEKALQGYDSPATLVPSVALQRTRQWSLPPIDELRARVQVATQAGKLKAAAFEPFLADVEASRTGKPIGLDYYAGTLVGAWLATQIVTTPATPTVPQGVAVLVLLRGASSIPHIRQRLSGADLPGVSLLELKGDVELLVSDYRQRALTASLIGMVVIFAALVLQLRRARAVASMVATIVFTVIITAGLLLLHQGQLTIFNLVALLLVVGVVSNYTLFFSTLSPEPDARQRESLSVLLAAASTLIGFSTLAFSSTPVLAMIGQTVAIGAAVGLGVSMVFSADRADLTDPGADPG